MQPLTSKTARQASILATLLLLLAVVAALLSCGPAAPPTPENAGIIPATPNTPTPELETASSPGGDGEPVAETYAAVRIWTCTSRNAPSAQALQDWLIDQGIAGWYILHAENFIAADHVSASLQDSLSRRDDVFAVDFIYSYSSYSLYSTSTTPPPTPPPDDQLPDGFPPYPPPYWDIKYPKFDRDIDDLAVASTKCHGTGWPAGTDPRVPVWIRMDTNLDTATTQAVISWLKANGISLRDDDLRDHTDIEGSLISVEQFPASLLIPLSEQPGVGYVEKNDPPPPFIP